MGEKTGRNEPCPCGSGKKYKQCCISKNRPTTASATPWTRQRDASEELTGGLMRLAARQFGSRLYSAWEAFNQTAMDEPLDNFPHEEAIFNPYLIYDWDRGTSERMGAVAQTYLEKNAAALPELQRQIIDQAVSRPVSFYEVVGCDPGRRVTLRDLLIGEETEIEDHAASKAMRPGAVAYAQIWILPEVAVLGRLAPRMIPPEARIKIDELRARLQGRIGDKIMAADLVCYADEIRAVYLAIRNELRKPHAAPVIEATL
jgi:hypothetical protein